MSEINSNETKELTRAGKIMKGTIAVALILSGAVAWYYFKATAPVMAKAAPKSQALVVETLAAALEDKRGSVSAMGTVTAAAEVTLKSRVAGTVLSVCDNFAPGTLVTKGQLLLELDPADYRVAEQKARSALASARAALAIEQGNQTIARKELKTLGQITRQAQVPTDLALRKPQLEQAQADLDSARADLDQATLNLSRTRMTAPFNGMIVERAVNVGSFAGTQEELLTLTGTDEFWVKALIPLDQVPFIDLEYPGGCPVTVRSQTGTGTWQGRVIQATGQLSEASRMAEVIVAVKNPLDKQIGTCFLTPKV